MNQRQVITGGPCTGKSTVIRELERRKYPVIHESARAHIEQELARGFAIEEIRADQSLFQEAILKLKIECEKATSPDRLVFIERGIPDTRAYARVVNIPETLLLMQSMKECYYARIFLLDPLPYENDSARTETAEESQALHEAIRNVYLELGFPIIEVPMMSVAERADFIVSRIA